MMRAVSPRSRLALGCAALALGCLGLGCVEVPDFPDPSLIDRPRVLAIVAEPPEANPGQDIAVSLLVAGTDSYEVSWRACGAFDSFVGGGQYGDDEPDEACGGGAAIELGQGPTAVLPGAISAQLFADLEIAAVILGAELPAETIERIRTSVGLPFMVEAVVRPGGKQIRAVKRVVISERPGGHRNPPPPHFRLGQIDVSALEGEPFRCAGPGGRPLSVPANTEIELAPVVEGEGKDAEEPWLERYPFLDLRGELRERKETAFYSWFTTGGDLEQGTTKSPLRNEIWRTPREPGCHGLWVVVRDGHGGSSACGVDVSVGTANACD